METAENKSNKDINFEKLSSWLSYEYIGPGDRYHPVNYDRFNGPEDRPFIWADDSMWGIDTSESPNSILPFLSYRYATREAPLDLRNKSIEFRIQSKNLDLKGGRCYFWILSDIPKVTRWHYISRPIDIPKDSWSKFLRIELENDESLWQNGSASNADSASLDHTLNTCVSFGFSILGFSDEVSGRLSLSSFHFIDDKAKSWSYSADFKNDKDRWLTVSRQMGKQTGISENIFSRRKELQTACTVNNDFLMIPNKYPYSYLLFQSSENSVHNHDLTNALIMIGQCSLQLDLKGGKIHFFLENTVHDTIWVYIKPIENDLERFILKKERRYWVQIKGEAPIESMLSGDKDGIGYDYLGIMAVNIRENPSGFWGMLHFSMGPIVSAPEIIE